MPKYCHNAPSITILPFDWGGWSELRVTAVLEDGRRLVGKLRGSNEENARLPKRAANSFIADQWKTEKRAAGADNSDEDSIPAGDGAKGDGLTLYEEYRGFYEDGKHIEGDPARKDYFIRNRTGGLAIPGIALFQRLSKLAVHHKLGLLEFPASRVINGNRRQGPHIVDQHGVIILVDPDLSGAYMAVGGPGNPKMIRSISLVNTAASEEPGYLASTVAHELFHAVNVWHHGERDEERVWKSSNGLTSELLGDADPRPTRIRVYNEPDRDVTDFYDDYFAGPPEKQHTMYIGRNRGQHSGVEDCVMRYDVSQAYESDSAVSVRYFISGEKVGKGLCTSARGTGVNQEGRIPQSRYGPASEGRGNCAAQILVTDAVTAVRR